MKKIRELIKLKTRTELSDRQIAKILNISRPVISEYWKLFLKSGVSFEQTIAMSDSAFLKLFEKHPKSKNVKYTTLSASFSNYVKDLKRKGVTLQLLWQEYIEKHSDGYSYSQFCYHFQMWRNTSEVTMHIEHKAGNKMFVDYAGTRMNIIEPVTNKKKQVEVFIAILGASGLTYVEASKSQEKEEWIRSNERALWYFGGVPQAIVPDNLKSAVTRSDPYEPGINPSFDDFADHYGTVIIPARVRKARDKALVENAVKLMYQRIYAPLRNRVFYSLEELNLAMWDLLEKHNTKIFTRLNYSRRDLFQQVEQKALMSLPSEKYKLKTTIEATIQFNYHVLLSEDKHYYSVPFYLRKKGQKVKAKIVYDDRIVAIYYDNCRIVQYARDRTINGYTTKVEHMPSHHRFYAEWSPQRILKWGKSYGEEVVQVLERVIKMRKHPEQAFKVCLGLLNLGKKYGEEYFKKACRKANKYGFYSLKRITNIIRLIIEEEKQPELEWDQTLPAHQNIRGSEYYK